MIAFESELLQCFESPGPDESYWTMRSGRRLLIRPIRPEDEPLLAQFHTMLSFETVYARYSQVLPLGRRTDHDRLAGRCAIDRDREIALVAIDLDAPSPCLIAVARLIRMQKDAAEFAIVIADSYQHDGLGTHLLRQLIEIGHNMNLARIVGYVNSDNVAMLAACARLGFSVEWPARGPIRNAVLQLAAR